MKKLYQLLHFIYCLHKNKKITGHVHSNYIVYVPNNDKYYNLSPIKVNDLVYYKNNDGLYDVCKVLNIYDNRKYYIQTMNPINNIYFTRTVERDSLYPYIINNKIKGKIKGEYFIKC